MMQKQQNIQPDGRSQADCGFSDAKNHFHAVSLRGGKDSTAMLLLVIERRMPIDAVLYADTGMEFPEMYGHLKKLDDHLYRERGLHITTLRHPKGFEWLMFEQPKQKNLRSQSGKGKESHYLETAGPVCGCAGVRAS